MNKRHLGVSEPLAPALYQSSVYAIPDLDALDQIYNATAAGYIYARDAHPNARELARKLTELEGGKWSVITSSGMAAISAILLPVLRSGGRIVAANRLYGRTTQLFSQEFARFGVATRYVDVNDLAAVEQALAEQPTQVLFVETMSNPLLRVPDLPRLVETSRRHKCLLVVDNTFATPVLMRPLALGADFVMESLTKIIGGHSDITLGLVTGRDEYEIEVNQAVSIWGLASNPFDCWLAERGLPTLGLRLRTASANALALSDWLATQPGVTRVVYPGRADHPDHAIATSLFGGIYGHMLCFELAGGRNAVNTFMRRAPGIPFSPSLGHTTTTCSHPATTSHRYTPPAEKSRQGIADGLVRLSVGCEDLAAIQAEMGRGLGI